jgi:hypothetical protein
VRLETAVSVFPSSCNCFLTPCLPGRSWTIIILNPPPNESFIYHRRNPPHSFCGCVDRTLCSGWGRAHTHENEKRTKPNHRNRNRNRSHANTSIAFKPAESGWGSGGKYTRNYDSIFASRPPTSSSSSSPAHSSKRCEQKEGGKGNGGGGGGQTEYG